MSSEPPSDAELETIYTTPCDGVETLHQQSQAQRWARSRPFLRSQFVSGGAVEIEDITIATIWTEQEEGHDERTCSYRDALQG